MGIFLKWFTLPEAVHLTTEFRVSVQFADSNTEICSVHEGILTRGLNIDEIKSISS